MYSDRQLPALKRLYNKTLWTHISISAVALAAAFLPAFLHTFPSEQLIPRLIAAGVGLVLAVSEYAVERSLLKKGKRVGFLSVGVLLAAMILCVVLAESGVYAGSTALVFPLFFSFMFIQPLIPAVVLLSDAGALRNGDLRETVGRIQAGIRRKDTEMGRETYLLFEDELTHETHLLRMGNVSPLHRYRVFYLPHSGLAVGEVVPDNVAFDPFGNPIPREAEADGPITENLDNGEEDYAEKPDRKEAEPAEKPWYQNPEAFSATPPKPEPKEDTSMPDPNSPERIKATKLGKAAKICNVLTFVFFGGMFLGIILTRENINPGIVLLTLPLFVTSIVLSEVFKSKELKIRCTRRATGFCVDTVRRCSGKHSHRYPIVEFEAGGVTHTVELSVSCSRDAVGDIYTLYYDPLDPDVVRPERRGLFD